MKVCAIIYTRDLIYLTVIIYQRLHTRIYTYHYIYMDGIFGYASKETEAI